MWPERDYRKALELIKEGVNDCEVGRRLGIPRGTIRDWRVALVAGSGGRTKEWTGRRAGWGSRPNTRPICDEQWMDPWAYAYLLGAYLGDGCLTEHPREVYRLRACDLKYSEIIDEIATSIVVVRADSVGFAPQKGLFRSTRTGSTGLVYFHSMHPGVNIGARLNWLPGKRVWWLNSPRRSFVV